MDIFYALAQPSRRKILEALAKGDGLSATRLYDKFDMSPQAVSQHLKVLRVSGLVKVEKKAQTRIYTLNPTKIHEFEKWIKKMNQVWEDRFDRLDMILKVEK